MPNRRAVMAGGAAMSLIGCTPQLGRYTGPTVTRVVVTKAARKLFLLNDTQVLKSYDIDLGFAPIGHKTVSGDGKTPEGSYWIDRKNPKSEYHLSIGISYPNALDIARAEALGEDPGGDIFVHGAKTRFAKKGEDWTWGCISVDNDEIEEIYAMVNVATQIDIHA